MSDTPGQPASAVPPALTDLQPWQGGGTPPVLFGAALAWLVLSAIAAGVAAWMLAGLAAAAGWVAPGRAGAAAEWIVLPLQQALMALGAVRRAWRVGDDDLRAGLGWLPVRRRGLVAALAASVLLVAAANAALVTALPGADGFFERAVPVLGGPQPGDAGWAAWIVATVVVGAPLSEELFFRGWLWAGLRRHWGAWATGTATGLLFLVVHGIGGEWERLVVLAPVTVLLSVAREVGGSVRASLAVHMANNALGAAGQIAAELLG